jgi:hypothetical protein
MFPNEQGDNMKKKSFAAFLLPATLALTASAALNAYRPAIDQQGVSFQNVQIPSAFVGLDGKTQPPGAYELHVKQGPQSILIGLLRNGKTVAEFQGKFVEGATPPPDPDRNVGKLPPDPIKARGPQDLHFDASSKVSTGGGGGAGKIFPSSKLHPGGANLGWIEFQLPQGQASGK